MQSLNKLNKTKTIKECEELIETFKSENSQIKSELNSSKKLISVLQENSSKNDTRFNHYEQIRLENKELQDKVAKLTATNSQLNHQVTI